MPEKKNRLNLPKPILVILTIFFSISGCYGLLFLFDNVWNGFLVNWVSNRFLSLRETIDPSTGNPSYAYVPDWISIKSGVLWLLIFAAVVLTILFYGVAHYSGKKHSKLTLEKSSQLIRNYFTHDIEASDAFPYEYTDLAYQMVQVKSQMQQKEQLLRDEASRKNDLITYLAHDLKTPLTSVIGYLSLLDEIPEMPAQQRAAYVHITLEKAIRLEKLINEFFEITRYNIQQIVLEKETFDLSYMLIQMTDEFYPILNAHGNSTELQIDSDLKLYGDPGKLARVFNNILKNAVAYSYENTPIQIKAAISGTTIIISFRNSGRTIPPERIDMIFDKFFRLDESRSSSTGGSGLGLAIAKDIVNQHGGTISAVSHDETTVFSVSLPLHKSE